MSDPPASLVRHCTLSLIIMAAILDLNLVTAIRNGIYIPYPLKTSSMNLQDDSLILFGSEPNNSTQSTSTDSFPVPFYRVTYDTPQSRDLAINSINNGIDLDQCETDEDCINPMTVCERKSEDVARRCYGEIARLTCH